MKKTIHLLLFSLFAAPAHARETILFSAVVDDETLAEEAIMLAQCISEKTGVSWEFSGEIRGSHWLKVRQEGQQLQATYHKEKQESATQLKAGASEEACEKLEPGSKEIEPSKILSPLNSLTPSLPRDSGNEEKEITGKTWLWAGAGAIALMGLLFWRSRQPDHRRIEMR